MGVVVRTESLTKLYGGTLGLSDLDLEINAGEVFGYLGPNGAGKTTTIRLLLDLIRPTRGRAEVLGFDSRKDSLEVRRRVGYLPGELALYENLTGTEFLSYFGALRGGISLRYAGELAERLDLDPSRRIGSLSRGNKQKVALVQSLMHRPDLLILDEPTSGLDPLVQHEFHGVLQELTSEGKTVFLSSHVLSEIELVAHRIGILRKGHLVVVEDIHTLRKRALRHLEIQLREPPAKGVFLRTAGVKAVEVVGNRVRLTVEGSVDAVVKEAARLEVLDLRSEEPDLEDIFLDYYREGQGDD